MFGLEKMSNVFSKATSPEKEKVVSIEKLHSDYLKGIIGQDELCKQLPVEKIDEFASYHKNYSPASNENVFKMNQLDNIIGNGGLEKGTYEAHGRPVIKVNYN